jgi:hypothetical protein
MTRHSKSGAYDGRQECIYEVCYGIAGRPAAGGAFAQLQSAIFFGHTGFGHGDYDVRSRCPIPVFNAISINLARSVTCTFSRMLMFTIQRTSFLRRMLLADAIICRFWALLIDYMLSTDIA